MRLKPNGVFQMKPFTENVDPICTPLPTTIQAYFLVEYVYENAAESYIVNAKQPVGEKTWNTIPETGGKMCQ